MATTGDTSVPEGMSPDAAFAVLGNETRMQILQTLGDAEGPVSYSDLRRRSGLPQGGQFEYHLDRLVGHFVHKSDDGYSLRQPGRRVVQAVLSGAVTENSRIQRTGIDGNCWWCGGSIRMSYAQERMNLFCPDCDGTYGGLQGRRPDWFTRSEPDVPADLGYLGCLTLPPAGVTNRMPSDAYRVGWVWELLEYFAVSNGVCPRCGGSTEDRVSVCDRHDADDGPCPTCGNRQAIDHRVRCRTCTYRKESHYFHMLYRDTRFLSFLTDHGLSPLRAESIPELFERALPYEEEIVSTDPLRARLTVSVQGETVELTIDETMSVIETVRQ